MNEGDIVTVLSQFGEIVDCRLIRDKETGKSKGFAYLAYEDQRSTDLAVDNLKRLIPFDADWMKVEAQGLHFVTDVQEVKTTWHPIENIGGATSSY